MHVGVVGTPNAEEEAVFAAMLGHFLARAAHERELLKVCNKTSTPAYCFGAMLGRSFCGGWRTSGSSSRWACRSV